MSASVGFLARMGIKSVGNAFDSLKDALVSFDPAAASQVDVDDLKNVVHELGLEISDAEQKEEADHKAMDDLTTRLAQTKQAAGMLAEQLRAAQASGDSVKITNLTANITKLVTQIKSIGGPEGDGSKSGPLFDATVKHHRSEERLHQRQQLHAAATANLATAQQRRQAAQEAMRDAQEEQRQAEMDRAAQERLAGLATRATTGNVALAAMEAKAAEAKKRARAAELDSTALKAALGTNNSADDIVAQTLAASATQAVQNDPLAELERLTGKAA